jgi:hypothetical protein
MHQKVIASALFAVLAGLTTVNAQSPTPSDAGAATPTATPQRETKGSLRSARESITDADARLCLEFPTNTQVIMCAEKYRPDRRRS